MKNPFLGKPIEIDPHYSVQFYAELWGVSASTAIRWFQNIFGVFKVSEQSNNGKHVRAELQIPFSLPMRVYREQTGSAIEYWQSCLPAGSGEIVLDPFPGSGLTLIACERRVVAAATQNQWVLPKRTPGRTYTYERW